RGVRVGADERVGICDRAAVLLIDEHGFREVFKIHLMDDPDVRRHDAAILKCLLSPLQKYVSFTIALEFAIRIEGKSRSCAELIDLDRVVDDEVHLLKRID